MMFTATTFSSSVEKRQLTYYNSYKVNILPQEIDGWQMMSVKTVREVDSPRHQFFKGESVIIKMSRAMFISDVSA